MYQLLLRVVPPPVADCIMALWYFCLILNILYYGDVAQADFPYANF